MKLRNFAHLAATAPGALYVLSPLDFIPDFIPLAGQADDAGVIVLMVMANLVIVLVVTLLSERGSDHG